MNFFRALKRDEMRAGPKTAGRARPPRPAR